MTTPDLLTAFSQPGKEELIKGLIEEFNRVNSEHKAFVETAKAALIEVSKSEGLTQRQSDILANAFGTQGSEFGKIDKSKIDSVPFDIILLYSELQNNPLS